MPASARLLYLHTEASRLVEELLGIIARPEVTRALEQELIHALIHCLTPDEGHAYKAFGRRSATVMARFEEALAVRAQLA